MRKFLLRNTPPGIDLRQELTSLAVLLALAAALSLGFYGSYFEARSSLFDVIGGRRYLIEGAVMADFGELIGPWFLGFAGVACYPAGMALGHCAHYRRGSMSIYLMRRLPDRTERHRRALVLPALALLTVAAAALLLWLICLAVYLLATPASCLPQGWRP